MESDPFFVSVIIPVYNGAAFLAEAVESIQRQAYEPLEIIIVDDGSTDSTAQIAASLKGNVRYTYQSNGGPASARNRGLRMACGNVIAFLDADDLWSEDKLELQLTRLTEDPYVDVVLGHTQRMQLMDMIDDKPKFKAFLPPWKLLHLGSAVFRKSVFDKVGYFDETLRYCEDDDWFIRASEQNVPIAILKQVSQFYRMHQHNMTHNTAALRAARQLYSMKVLKRSIDRHRQQGSSLAASLP